jgi:uncharacterized protein (DUF58 family)
VSEPASEQRVGGSRTTAFNALELRLRRRLNGRLQGDHAGVRLGPGSESEEIVRYRPGEDDVRRIDWNVTARSQEPHVWRSRADHELDTWVLVDETASMSFGTVELEKGDLATGLTAAIGLLIDGPGNRLGVAHLRSEGVAWSRPLSGRRAARRALARRTAPHVVTGADAVVDLAEGIRLMDARHRRPGLRVIVSDLVEPDGRITRPFPWERQLRRLGARHETLVVEVLDPRELALPDVGPVVLVDPESGHRCEVWTSLPSIRERYAEAAATHRHEVAAAVRAAGAGHVVLRTDRDWVADLARFVLRHRHATRPRRTR